MCDALELQLTKQEQDYVSEKGNGMQCLASLQGNWLSLQLIKRIICQTVFNGQLMSPYVGRAACKFECACFL